MQYIVLPFGLPAWERRKEVLRGIIAARPGPPYDFRGVLYLVPNERKARTLKALFLDVLETETSARACIPPEITALNMFIGGRAAAASQKPMVGAMTRSLALEEVCRRLSPADWPGATFEGPRPSLVPRLSQALDTLYKRRVDDSAVRPLARDLPPLALLLKVKAAYERWLDMHGLADLCYPRPYSPEAGEFSGLKSVVLDGFYDADPSETPVLKALSAVPDCLFLLEAPGLSKDMAGRAGSPYLGADRLLDALGLGCGPDAASYEAEALSGALFMGTPLSETRARLEGMKGWPREVRVVGALNEAEEVYFIARDIKRAHRDEGLNIGRVLVFFPDLDSRLPVLEEAFGDLGVPYHISQGHPLMQSPAAQALLDILSLPLNGYAFRDMRRVFNSPLMDIGGDAGAFDEFARRAGITRGRRRWLETGALRPCFERLFALTGPFEANSRMISKWSGLTRGILQASGLADSVEGLKADRPELSHALSCMIGVLEEMSGASARLKGRAGLPEFLHILRKSLAGRRYRPGTDSPGGVKVLGALETLSGPFDRVYAGGLVEGALPQAPPPDIFFPPEAARRLGVPGGDPARARDARLMLGLMMCAPKVFLSCPESKDGSPAPPSPYIRALEPFFRAGVIKKQSHLCRPLDPALAEGPAERLRALALGAAIAGVPGPGVHPPLHPFPSREGKSPQPPFYKGGQEGGCSREFKVTELAQYNLCRYRYYQARVAGLAPQDEPDDDMAPNRAGSIIHEILRDFYADGRPVTPQGRKEAIEKLIRLADDRFKTLPDTTANRGLWRGFTETLAPRFIETEAGLYRTGMAVCGAEIPVTMEEDDPEAGHVVITGRIDRVEIARGGEFIVGDYKTGGYPGSGRPIKEMFQLPLYAYMLKKRPESMGKGPRPTRPAGLVYYNLKKGPMRDAVAYIEGFGPEKTSRWRGKSPEGMDGLLGAAFKQAMEAVRGILAGRFEPTCKYEFICRRCDYAVVCARGKKAGDAEGGDDGED